jgi:hypothetical protein
MIPLRLVGQSPDSSSQALRSLIDALPPAAALRLGIAGERWTGRLAVRSPDSLVLSYESGTRTIRLPAIDTLWLRGPRRHDGLLAGAAFGAVMFALLHLAQDAAGDPWYQNRLGFALFAGAVGGGLLVDAVSDPWIQHYPTWR